MADDAYKAIANYAPIHGDEIKLTLGDKVTLLHSYDDGKFLILSLTVSTVKYKYNEAHFF